MKNNDANFEFLTEYITSKVVEWIIRDQNIGIGEALLQFHNSETFDKLNQQKTDLYIESPAYIYEIYKHEIRYGSLKGISN